MRAVTAAAERSRARFHELTNQEADMGICGCAKWTKVGCDSWCRYKPQIARERLKGQTQVGGQIARSASSPSSSSISSFSRCKLGTVGPAFLGYLLCPSAQLPTPKQSVNFIIIVRILRVRLLLLLGGLVIPVTSEESYTNSKAGPIGGRCCPFDLQYPNPR